MQRKMHDACSVAHHDITQHGISTAQGNQVWVPCLSRGVGPEGLQRPILRSSILSSPYAASHCLCSTFGHLPLITQQRAGFAPSKKAKLFWQKSQEPAI